MRVVFTNGVFDILHAGHVDLLERARGLGDALILGINSDASVRGLGKGRDRPVNRLRDRARLAAALACVDAVVAFGGTTPERLVRLLRPERRLRNGRGVTRPPKSAPSVFLSGPRFHIILP